MYVDSDCGAFGSPPKYSCGPPNKMLRIFGQLGIRKLKYLGAAMVCVSPAPTQLPLDPRSHIFLLKNTPTMKSVIFAAAIASAAAFAPAPVAKTTSSLNAFESELGAQPPLGFYDPLGFLDGADQERFDRLRYVELKHGRISQLAFLGQITTRAGFHLPGSIDGAGDSFDSFPNGFAALGGPDSIPAAGTGQILFFIGALELAVMKDVTGENEFVGDFRNGYIDFGWDSFDEATKLKKRAVELNQGRAAMMGILGLMVHEQLGGSLPIVGEM